MVLQLNPSPNLLRSNPCIHTFSSINIYDDLLYETKIKLAFLPGLFNFSLNLLDKIGPMKFDRNDPFYLLYMTENEFMVLKRLSYVSIYFFYKTTSI